MKLSREELIQRLKEISEDQTQYEMSHGAMCYSPSICDLQVKCNSCDKKLERRLFKSEYKSIYDKVKQIRALGYDAKVEDLCLDCVLKKISSGEYIATFKDFNNVGYVADSWDENLRKAVRKDLTDDEIIRLLKEYYPELVYICFYFRLNKDESYHMAQSNNNYDYQAVLNFLKDKRSYLGDYEETVLLRDEIEDIEKMTGITLAKKA